MLAGVEQPVSIADAAHLRQLVEKIGIARHSVRRVQLPGLQSRRLDGIDHRAGAVRPVDQLSHLSQHLVVAFDAWTYACRREHDHSVGK